MVSKNKTQKSLKRGEIREEIYQNDLVGRVISVIGTTSPKIEGILTFYQNTYEHKKTGYYIGEKQIPLLSIKEIGGDYLIV
ncbi:MAG: hypothetical protein AABX99_03160 [Nanoarchaeota archaeon]